LTIDTLVDDPLSFAPRQSALRAALHWAAMTLPKQASPEDIIIAVMRGSRCVDSSGLDRLSPADVLILHMRHLDPYEFVDDLRTHTPGPRVFVERIHKLCPDRLPVALARAAEAA
jgi:hypothetical protein